MAEMMGSAGGPHEEGNNRPDRARRKAPIDTQYFSTARTAPRAPHESRIGTDEAHARLQEARNNARRDIVMIHEDLSADN